MVDVNELFKEMGNIPEVCAIALGGSRATGRNFIHIPVRD